MCRIVYMWYLCMIIEDAFVWVSIYLKHLCFAITNRQSLKDINAKVEQQEQLLADNEKTGLNNVMCFASLYQKSIHCYYCVLPARW